MAATKAPREKLTLRDAMDLMQLLNRYVEEHIDEIEMNGGALPDDLAAMLDEIDLALADRADALANKIDEFEGYAFTAKATKDRAGRREKVWNNIIKSMKSYGLLQVQRNGGAPIKGAAATLRMQRNGQPSTECLITSGELLAIHDAGPGYDDPSMPEGSVTARSHPLLPYIRVVREATLDMKALAAAYEARRAELEAEADLIGESDIDDEALAAMGPPDATRAAGVADVLTQMRALYIADNLAAEFPGVRCERSFHLRID